MPKFQLSKPININGETVTELSYNLEDMTAQDKANATKAYKKAGNMVMVQELDSDYHLYLFSAAVKKVDSSIEAEDVLRMSARDSVKAEALVRDFFFIISEESSAMNTSQDALLN
ncbi:phage tail assembly protein [Paenibacillus sp. NPDC058367]|uniref:phage tail assembly protein n=1 Tax=Paenibacillus sp. NPDC058367 TaxID=3346460 RepID=UPI003659EC5D